MDSSDNLYDDLDKTNVSEVNDSQNASAQDFNLFEDCIISKETEKVAKKYAELTERYENAIQEINSWKQKFNLLEEDAKTLMRNISSLWKTAVAQIQKKDKQIIALQKEKEGIIFRRAMRQIPKDELDRVVSRIAAYDKREFVEFMKTFNSAKEPQENRFSSAFPKVKYKSDQAIKNSVLGTRVNEKQHVEALRLQKLQGRTADVQYTQSNFKISKLSENKFHEKQELCISKTLKFGENKTNEENERCDSKVRKSFENETSKRNEQNISRLGNEIEGAKTDIIVTNNKVTEKEISPIAVNVTGEEKQHNEYIGSSEGLPQDPELEEGECSDDSCNLEKKQLTTTKIKAGQKEKKECPDGSHIPTDHFRESKREIIDRRQKAEHAGFKSESANAVKESSIETTSQARCEDSKTYRIPKVKKSCDEKENEGKEYQNVKSISTVKERESRSYRKHSCKTLAERNDIDQPSGGNRKDRPEQRTSSRESVRDDGRTRNSPREQSGSYERRSRTHSHDKKSPHGKTEHRRHSPRKGREWGRETRHLVERLRDNKIREGMLHKRSYSRQPHLSVYARRRIKREMEESRRDKYRSNKKTTLTNSSTHRDRRSERHHRSGSSATSSRTHKGEGSRESSRQGRETSGRRRSAKEQRERRERLCEMKERKTDEKSAERRVGRMYEENRGSKLQKTESDSREQGISEEMIKQKASVDLKRQRIEESESARTERNSEKGMEHLKMTEHSNSVLRRSKSLERGETSRSREATEEPEKNLRKRVKSSERETQRKKRSCNSDVDTCAVAKMISLKNVPPLSDAQFRCISEILNAAKGANANLDATKQPLSTLDLRDENISKLPREVEDESTSIQGSSTSQGLPREVEDERISIQGSSTSQGLPREVEDEHISIQGSSTSQGPDLSLQESISHAQEPSNIQSSSPIRGLSAVHQEPSPGDKPTFKGVLSLPESKVHSKADGFCTNKDSNNTLPDEEAHNEGDTLDTYIRRVGIQNLESVTLQNDDSEMSLLRFLENKSRTSPEKSSIFIAVSPPSFVIPTINSPIKTFHNHPNLPQSSRPNNSRASDMLQDNTNFQTAAANPPQLMRADHLSPICTLPMQSDFTVPTPPLGRLPYSLKTFQEMETPIKNLSTSSCSPIPVATPLDAANNLTATCTPPPFSSTLKSSTPVVVFDLDKKCLARNSLPPAVHQTIAERNLLFARKEMPKSASSGIQSSENTNQTSKHSHYASDTEIINSSPDQRGREAVPSISIASLGCDTSQESIYSEDKTTTKKKVPFFTISKEVSRRGNLVPNSDEYKACGFASSFYKNLDEFEQDWPARTKYTHSSQNETSSVGEKASLANSKISPTSTTTFSNNNANSNSCSSSSSSSSTGSSSSDSSSSRSCSTCSSSSNSSSTTENKTTGSNSGNSPYQTSFTNTLLKSTKNELSEAISENNNSSPLKQNHPDCYTNDSTKPSPMKNAALKCLVKTSVKKSSFQSSPAKRVRSSPMRQVQSSPTERVHSSPTKSVHSSPTKRIHSSPTLEVLTRSNPVENSPESSPLKKTPAKSSPMKKASTRRTPVKQSPSKSRIVKSPITKSGSVKRSPTKSNPVKKPNKSSPAKISPSKTNSMKNSSPKSRSPNSKKSSYNASSLEKPASKSRPEKNEEKSSPLRKSARVETMKSVKDEKLNLDKSSGKRIKPIHLASKTENALNSADFSAGFNSSSKLSRRDEETSQFSKHLSGEETFSSFSHSSELKDYNVDPDFETSYVPNSIATSLSQNQKKELVSESNPKEVSQSMDESALSQSSTSSLDISSNNEKSLDKSRGNSDTALGSENEQIESEHIGNVLPVNHSSESKADTEKSSADSSLEVSTETSTFSSSIASANSSSSREIAKESNHSSAIVEECHRTSTIQSTVDNSFSNVSPASTLVQGRTPKSDLKVTPEGVCFVKTPQSRFLSPSTPCNVISIVYSGEEERPECNTKRTYEDLIGDDSRASSKKRRRKQKSPTGPATKQLNNFQADRCKTLENPPSQFSKNKESISPLASQVIIRPIKRRKVSLTASITSNVSTKK